tara:strand:- start:122 stop:994 length:873 start_codon:yes stop_codon:yes gene_type:complete
MATWQLIVNKSPEQNEYITLEELLYIKSKLSIYDIFRHNENTYILIDKTIDKPYVKAIQIEYYHGIQEHRIPYFIKDFSIINNYKFKNYENKTIKLFLSSINHTIINTLEDRNLLNVKYANSLNIGDIFTYSLYNCEQYCNYANSIKCQTAIVYEKLPEGIVVCFGDDIDYQNLKIIPKHLILTSTKKNQTDITPLEKNINEYQLFIKYYDNHKNEYLELFKLINKSIADTSEIEIIKLINERKLSKYSQDTYLNTALLIKKLYKYSVIELDHAMSDYWCEFIKPHFEKS